MSHLFSPFTIKNTTLKNRLVVSPMCQYSSVDGFANDWHLVHLGTRAVGGAGLVFTEAAAVSPEGRITPDDLGIWKDKHIEYLKRITAFIELHGSVAGIQLAHAGRKASHSSAWKGAKALVDSPEAWQTLAPSCVTYAATDPLPKEMTIAEIEQCITDFEKAAQRSLDAGFKVIEIHAAHGYLINEFLSPLSNKRTDEYGGSFENRIRFLLEIVSATRKVIGNEIPLFVRISATDWVDEGWILTDSIKLCTILKSATVDLIDCSTGGNSRDQKIPVGPLYQVSFSEQIKNECAVATGAVGMITTAEEAESILQYGQADLIFMARELLRNPYFPLEAAKILGDNIAWPKQYDRAK
jgi:2,4-dienoyl-CoA reductase-like NADH-dependent reductase (Old Yellow Enzyme family)